MYSFTIPRALRTKAQVICAHSKEIIRRFFFDFFDGNMSTKIEADSECSRVSCGAFFF